MTEHNFEHMRRAMVAEPVAHHGVNDPRVVAAMGAVPRERFVPENYVSAAYTDFLVPLGHGRELNSPMALGGCSSEAGCRGMSMCS
jgi:protein-L-isoaspartate(D-aspartate) O-methyltransferase